MAVLVAIERTQQFALLFITSSLFDSALAIYFIAP